MGDLNFRLDGSLGAEEIAAKVQARDLSSLLKMDELKKAQEKQDAFEPLIEGPVTFPPTYKYKEKSQAEYDLR